MFEDPDTIARLAYLTPLLAGLCWFYFKVHFRSRGRAGASLRPAFLWALIFAAVIAGYAVVAGR